MATVYSPATSPPKQRLRVPKKPKKEYLWVMPHSVEFFTALANFFRPVSLIAKLLALSLIVVVPVGVTLFFKNLQIILTETKFIYQGGIPFLLHIFINMFLIGFFVKFVKSTVCTSFGGKVKVFALTLTLGFHPRFYVDRKAILRLPWRYRIITFTTPMLFRLGIISYAVLIWYWTRNTGIGLTGSLGTFALLLAHSCFFELLFESTPVASVDGYYLLITSLGIPTNSLMRTFEAFGLMISGRPLPPHFNWRKRLTTTTITVLSVIFHLLLVGALSFLWAHGFNDTYPGVLGEGSEYLFYVIFVTIAFYRPVKRRVKAYWQENPWQGPAWLLVAGPVAVMTGLGVLLFLPFTYQPSGDVQLFAPQVVSIQAQISGVVTQVNYPGGTTQVIPASTVLGTITSVEVNNSILTTEDAIRKGHSDIKTLKSELALLRDIPRPEDVAVAQQKVAIANQAVAVAQEGVAVAAAQLRTDQQKSQFSSREAARYQQLYRRGVVSLQTEENFTKQAEDDHDQVLVDLEAVSQAQQTVAQSQEVLAVAKGKLQEVLSGADPAAIARKASQMEAAEKNLARLQQVSAYYRQQQSQGKLLMPITGQLVTPYLNQKVGIYLKQGETFALASPMEHLRAEMQVIQTDSAMVEPGQLVQIHLMEFPDTTFLGQVEALQPQFSEATNELIIPTDSSSADDPQTPLQYLSPIPSTDPARVLRATIRLHPGYPDLKAGMSGYARIQGPIRPFGVALTHPFTTFWTVEGWSWMP